MYETFEVLWVANRKITVFLGCYIMQAASKVSVFCKNLLPPSSSRMKCQAAPFTRPLVPSHSLSQFSLISHTTLDLYLEEAQFESWHHLSWQSFFVPHALVYLSKYKNSTRVTSLTPSTLFPIHQPSYCLMLHSEHSELLLKKNRALYYVIS
jgi:hypothetical protein